MIHSKEGKGAGERGKIKYEKCKSGRNDESSRDYMKEKRQENFSLLTARGDKDWNWVSKKRKGTGRKKSFAGLRTEIIYGDDKEMRETNWELF